ncbi:MAG: PLP-dependent transferase, partial [Pseudomonadota bacterium]
MSKETPPGINARLLSLLHHRAKTLRRGDGIGLPIAQTSTYFVPGPPEADYTYTRDGNPTWTAVETQLSILENAPAVAFPSGMGGIAAVLYTQLSPGDKIVLPSDGYFAVRALVNEFVQPLGIEVVAWPTA